MVVFLERLCAVEIFFSGAALALEVKVGSAAVQTAAPDFSKEHLDKTFPRVRENFVELRNVLNTIDRSDNNFCFFSGPRTQSAIGFHH